MNALEWHFKYSLLCISGSQSVDPVAAAEASPGNMLDMQMLGLSQDLLNQIIWGWGPAIYLKKSSR